MNINQEQQIVAVLKIVYERTGSPQEVDTAHNWIIKWKETANQQNWAIAFNLFQNLQYPAYVHHFAALCLHHYLHDHQFWKLLPPQNYANLLKALFDLLCKSNLYEKAVANRICTVIADIGIRTFPQEWPTFFIDMFGLLNASDIYEEYYIKERELLLSGGTAEDKEEFLSQKSKESTAMIPSILLSYPELGNRLTPFILKIFSEMIGELEKIPVRRGCRDAVSIGCKVRTRALLFALSRLLDIAPVLSKDCLLTIQQWTKIAKVKDLLDTKIFDKLLLGITNKEYTTEYCDCFLELLVELKEFSKLPKTVIIAIKHVGSLTPLFAKLKESEEDEDYKLAMSICKVVGCLIEDYSDCVVDNLEDGGIELIRLALMCTSHKERELSLLMLDLWYILSFWIESNVEDFSKYSKRNIFVSAYSELLKILLAQSMYESDALTWDEEDSNEFATYRTNLTDTFQYCYSILKDDYLIESMKILQELVRANGDWNKTEAILFGLSCIGSFVDDSSSKELVSSVFDVVQLSYSHPLVRNAILMVISEYAESLTVIPEKLPGCLTYIVSAMSTAQCIPAATKAMSLVCRSCSSLLVTHYSTLHSIFTPHLSNFNYEEKQSILDGLSCVIRNLAPDTAYSSLCDLIKPIDTSLTKLLSEPAPKTPEVYEQLEKAIQNEIELLCTICNTFKNNEKAETDSLDKILSQPSEIKNPLARPMLAIWPKIESAKRLLPNSSLAILRLIKTLLYAVGTPNFIAFLPSASQLILNIFQTSQDPEAYKTVASIFIAYDSYNFSLNPHTSKCLTSLLVQLCTGTLTHLQTNSASLDANIIRFFFEMLSKIYIFTPTLLLTTPAFGETLTLAINLIPKIVVPAALKAIVQYVRCYLDKPKGYEQSFTDNIVKQIGPVLIANLFMCMTGALPKRNSSVIGGAVHQLVKSYPMLVREWAMAQLSSPTFPAHVTQAERMKFLSSILEHSCEKKFVQNVAGFTHICRGENESTVICLE